MNFLIADTFTDSLAHLTGDEQKAVKTTAFDLQMNLANPGANFHKLDRARDKNFWSVRVNRDIRIIVHKTAASLLLCYVNHHDKAYEWAERRKLETHPATGAAQLVEIRETVQEIRIPIYAETVVAAPAKPLFSRLTEEQILSYGVPPEWVADVQAATEDNYLALAEHLPAEAAEALLEIAIGGEPRIPDAIPSVNPFEHTDAKRRFRILTNMEELERALEFPWEKWTVFLHPEQREWVEREYSGPARVCGSAGTGKTIVALHRAAHLVRVNLDARVLLATYSEILADTLRTKLNRLLKPEPALAERVEVSSLPALGLRLHKARLGPVLLAERELIADLLTTHRGTSKFSLSFLLSEWEQVVDAWQLRSWDEYRDVARLGRKTRLPEAARKELWIIFNAVIDDLRKSRVKTEAEIFTDLASVIIRESWKPFDFAVVDEAQDLGVAHLRFFAAMGAARKDALFFAGDLGQRIFQTPFSWKSLGVDIRGRSRRLRVNYRTSHQIRTQADRLLGREISDVDGNSENRTETVSVFNGPSPIIAIARDTEEEKNIVANWLRARITDGVQPEEIGIIVRSESELLRAKDAAAAGAIPFKILEKNTLYAGAAASISTMHLAKGLEFRVVVVMACDDEIIPLQARIEMVGDDADLQEVYETERHLLYVACTRARDHLLVSSVEPASEFLDDLNCSDVCRD